MQRLGVEKKPAQTFIALIAVEKTTGRDIGETFRYFSNRQEHHSVPPTFPRLEEKRQAHRFKSRFLELQHHRTGRERNLFKGRLAEGLGFTQVTSTVLLS